MTGRKSLCLSIKKKKKKKKKKSKILGKTNLFFLHDTSKEVVFSFCFGGLFSVRRGRGFGGSEEEEE